MGAALFLKKLIKEIRQQQKKWKLFSSTRQCHVAQT